MKEKIEMNSVRKAYRKLNNIELLDFNPRYTNIVDIDWNEVKEKGNNKMQDNIALELLSFEEDFTNFKTLLKSLSKGYDQDQDQPIAIQTKDKKTIVIEGNRRILASKMLSNITWANSLLDKMLNIINITGDNKTVNSDLEEVFLTEDKTEKINSVKNLINNLSESGKININEDQEIFMQLYLYKEDNFNEEALRSIRNSILGRSVSAPGGKMRWPRYQTLKNTYDIFKLMKKNGEEEPIEATAEYLNRSKSSIESELKSATFIFLLKDSCSFKDIDWKKMRTSAIELSISTINISNITRFNTIKEFYNIHWDIDSDKLSSNINDTTKIADFLIGNYLMGNYSTRGWKKSKSKKNLFEFLGITYITSNFQETLNSKNEKNINAVRKILSVNNEIEIILKKIQDKNNSENFSIPKQEQSPENILRKYVSRVLSQEINLLTTDLELMDEKTYPYYSIVSIGRNVFELMLTYLFVVSEEIRRDVLSYPKNTKCKKLQKYAELTEKEIFERVYPNYHVYNLTPSIKRTYSDNKYEVLIQKISNDTNFAHLKSNFEIIFEKYNNKYFNSTVHKPYWLIYNENLSTIGEITTDSLEIIQNFAKILGVDL